MVVRIRGLKVWLAAALLAALAAEADARGRRSRSYETVELAAVRSTPRAFIGKRIAFDCFFAKLGRIYQPFHTPFVAEQFLNFHVWEPGTKLWDNKERKKAFLFCYVPRDLENQVDYVMRRSMYESLRVFGRVVVVYADQPWFDVEDVEPSVMSGIPETALNHILVGIKSLTYDDYEMAQESFKEAIKAGLPRSAQDFAQRELGKACYELGRYTEADTALRIALQVSPSDPWILLKRGQSLSRAADGQSNEKRKKRMLAEALGYLDRARKLAPANPDCHAEIGWVRAKRGDVIAGIRDVKRAIALKSTAASFRILGRIYIQMGKLAAAENQYHNAIVRDYSNPLYHREVADLYMTQGRYEDAESEYGNLIQLTGTEPEGYILRAKALLRLGKTDEAVKDYEKALSHDSENLDALLGRAAVYRDRGDYEKARRDLAQAERLAPKDVAVLVAFAEIPQAQGRQAQRLQEEAEAEGRQEDAEAEGRSAQRFYDDAVGAYAGILKQKVRGSLGRAHYGQGVCLAGKPKPDLRRASASFQKAVGLEPDNVEYRKALAEARAHNDLGQFSLAVRDLQEIKRRAPADERSRILLAHAMAETGKPKEAMKELEDVLRDIPDSLYARNNLAYLLLEYGKPGDQSRATSLAQEAYDKDKANPDFQDTLGWARYRNADPDGARGLLMLAIIKSEQPEPYYHLAKVLNELGEKEAAREHLEEALRRLDPKVIPRPGVATKRLKQAAIKLAPKVGASTRPRPRTE